MLAQAQDALRRLGVKGDSVEGLAKPPRERDPKAGLEELESLDLGGAAGSDLLPCPRNYSLPVVFVALVRWRVQGPVGRG